MGESELHSLSYLMSSVQRGLLDEVSSDLRGVAASLDGNTVRLRFLYDENHPWWQRPLRRGLTDQQVKLASVIAAEVIAAYPEPFTVEDVPVYLPSPRRRDLESDDWAWAYLRREHEPY